MAFVSKQAILKIGGKAQFDGELASEFSLALKGAAEQRSRRIAEVFNLQDVLCHDTMQTIRSDLAGLRHINAVVTEVAQFHAAGPLGTAMNNLQAAISSLLRQAEEQYLELSGLYPR